jgi:branched-chain amino acid transport system ATP-binding protein
MDEPSVGLSPLIVDEIFAIIKQLNEDGMSILLVEQNATKALQVADYFYLLDQGKVTFSGTPDQLKDDDIIKRAYLGGG